jgi:hypothetical protein
MYCKTVNFSFFKKVGKSKEELQDTKGELRIYLTSDKRSEA